MVSLRLLPGTEGTSPTVSIDRPELSTKNCKLPAVPVSQRLYCRSMPLLPISEPKSKSRNSRIASSLRLAFPMYPVA